MYVDKKTKERLALGERISIALGMVGFNQGLVQFADSKANGLLLVNSIFLASMVSALDAPGGGRALAVVFFVACVVALLASLRVMLARAVATDDPRPRSLFFHKHITGFSKGQSYVDEVRASEGEPFLDALLLSNYDLAGIASAKFAAYKTAERLTLVSAVLWIGGMLVAHVL